MTVVVNPVVSGGGGVDLTSPGPIGGTTSGTGAFTTLTATGAVTLSPASLAVNISPTGAGATVTVSPFGALTLSSTVAGSLNNCVIGGTTPKAASFITVNTNGFTVAGLPAGTVGDRAYVTDALAPTYGAALTGGGAVVVPVFRNATVWVSA